MPFYRKKPVVIEARRVICADPMVWEPRAARKLAEWCGGRATIDAMGPCILIDTLEGQMRADLGDWIIRGVNGEFYPCKPDIFDATYEVAEGAR